MIFQNLYVANSYQRHYGKLNVEGIYGILAPNVPKYTNFDPEVNSFGSSNVQGIELSAAPTTRRFGFNVSVTF